MKVDGVTWSAGIRNGDRLISINGKPVINTLVASKTLDVVPSGDYAVYVVERNGKQFTTNVYIKKLVSFNNLAFTLLSSFWLVVGFFVLMAKPEGKIQRLFFSVAAFSVLFSMNSLLTRGQQVDNPILRNLFLLRTVDILILAGGVFWAFSMVRFFSVFPVESNFEKKKWIRKTLILSPWIISVLVLTARIRFVYIDRTQLGVIITSNCVGFLIVASLITSFVLLIISYRKVDAQREKRALRIILAAHTIGLSAIIYFIL